MAVKAPQCGNCGSYKVSNVRTITILFGFICLSFFAIAGIFFPLLWAGCLIGVLFLFGSLFNRGKTYKCLECHSEWTVGGVKATATNKN